jgi:hypothetical protein
VKGLKPLSQIQQYRLQLSHKNKQWAERVRQKRIVTNTEPDQRARDVMEKVGWFEIEIKRLKGELLVGRTPTSATSFAITQDEVIADRTSLFGPGTPL